MIETTRKPTARMIEALRSAGADGLISDRFAARTCEGLVSRGMAERSSVGYTVTDAGRLYLGEVDGTPHEAAHDVTFIGVDGQFRHADRSHGAYMSAQDNADQTAREEGFDRYTERWYALVNSSYASLVDDGEFTEPGQEAAEEAVSAPEEAYAGPLGGITYRDRDGRVERCAFVGAVLGTREQNLYHDSYFHAVVWDEERQEVRSVEYGATAYYSNTTVTVDATREVIGKAVAHRAAAYLADWEADHGKRVHKGMTARVTVEGETLTGTVAWVGESRPNSAWEARYGTRTARYGIKVEGRAKYVFRNADSPSLEVDVPAWTAEERAEMIERAEGRARHDFREALRAADEREPLPAAPAPGDVVDSQEADADGWRLYALGAPMIEEGTARAVAAAIVDSSARAYTVEGRKVSGAALDRHEVPTVRALGHVANAMDTDGARILHDGHGAVRVERADGAFMVLRPVVVAHVGALEEDKEDATVRAALAVLDGAGVWLATLTNRAGDMSAEGAFVSATRKAGRVRVVEYTNGSPVEPAEGMTRGRRERLRESRNLALDEAARVLRGAGWTVMVQEDPTAGTRLVRALEAEPPAQERQEAAQGAQEGTAAAWVAQGAPMLLEAATGAVLALLDTAAPRYRRTVLRNGGGAGLSGTLETGRALRYLAEEVADGGTLAQPGAAGALVLTRANGARLLLEPGA